MVAVGCNAIAVTSHTHKFVSRDGEELAEGRGPDFVLPGSRGLRPHTSLRMECPEINQRDAAAASSSITRVRSV